MRTQRAPTPASDASVASRITCPNLDDKVPLGFRVSGSCNVTGPADAVCTCSFFDALGATVSVSFTGQVCNDGFTWTCWIDLSSHRPAEGADVVMVVGIYDRGNPPQLLNDTSSTNFIFDSTAGPTNCIDCPNPIGDGAGNCG
jgi:hypothetical protein